MLGTRPGADVMSGSRAPSPSTVVVQGAELHAESAEEAARWAEALRAAIGGMASMNDFPH